MHDFECVCVCVWNLERDRERECWVERGKRVCVFMSVYVCLCVWLHGRIVTQWSASTSGLTYFHDPLSFSLSFLLSFSLCFYPSSLHLSFPLSFFFLSLHFLLRDRHRKQYFWVFFFVCIFLSLISVHFHLYLFILFSHLIF